jgi:hypothetical protein
MFESGTLFFESKCGLARRKSFFKLSLEGNKLRA